MTDTTIIDWDDAYSNAAHIADAADFPPRWAEEAREFRTSWMEKDIDVIYGESARQRFDVFHPEEKSKGLLIFVHGGYWLKFDKSSWSHLAAGSLGRGWTVCLPSYDLVPDVRIEDITRQIGTAIKKASERVDGPIRLSGHSAGGHLVTRMLCEDTPLPGEVLERIARVVSISGLHDLRPLTNTQMNEAFQMTEADAANESPALMNPVNDCPVTAWVGGDERPEFLRQSRLLAEAWPTADSHAQPGRHHFDVIEDLKDRESDLISALLKD